MKLSFSRLTLPTFLSDAAIILVALALFCTSTSAAPPAWWQMRGVLDANQTRNDFAAVNTGQLKHIAKQAMLELDAKLPGGAGAAIHQLVDSWPQETTGRNDFAAVNVGQVKAISKLFYDRLNQIGFGLRYPWDSSDAGRNDFTSSNVGQLKHVFSFLVDQVTTADTDGDGIPDWWEARFFGAAIAADASADFDGDGLSNLAEWQNHASPLLADTDGDSWEDAVEVAAGNGVIDSGSNPQTSNPTFLNDFVTIKQTLVLQANAYSISVYEKIEPPSETFYTWGYQKHLSVGGEFIISGENEFYQFTGGSGSGFGWPPPMSAFMSESEAKSSIEPRHWLPVQTGSNGEILLTDVNLVNQFHPPGDPGHISYNSNGNIHTNYYSGVRSTLQSILALSLCSPQRLPVSVQREFYAVISEYNLNESTGIWSGPVLTEIKKLSFILSPQGKISESQLIMISGSAQSTFQKSAKVEILTPAQYQNFVPPMEVAPDVLAVNTNFDEGDVDPTTHYAKPDCENGTLKAVRDHLDGDWEEGDIVAEDLHRGFFGLRPGILPYSETSGAVVKIKKLDKNDPETGRKQSGNVRLYAVWGAQGSESEMQIELYDKISLAANDIGPQLYQQNPNTSVEYYLEGVEPGKITLEFSYQKGSTSFIHEQEFLVATHKTREEWRDEVRYQIRLQESTFPAHSHSSQSDIADLNPSLGFRQPLPTQDNSRLISLMYYYYAQLFHEHQDEFMWPGMARVAATSIYAGMSDMYLWNTNFITGGEPGAVGFVNDFMIPGAQAIFNDLAWSHRAYAASGIYAIKHLDETESGSVNLSSWQALDDGIAENNMTKIRIAGEELLNREQNTVIQRHYATTGPVRFKPPGVNYLWAFWIGGVEVTRDAEGKCEIGEWMSANAVHNPILGPNLIPPGSDYGPLSFRSVVPGGRLDNAVHRWSWISHPEHGMLPRWSGSGSGAGNYSPADRLNRVLLGLHESALIYSQTGGVGLPLW